MSPRTQAPIAVVHDFIAAWNARDFGRIAALLAADVFYHNVPLEPLRGRDAVDRYLRKMEHCEAIEWRLLNVAADGPIVLTERVDEFVIRGVRVSLPVMGAFEIRDGEITAWRDYFDLASYRAQLARVPA